MYYRGGGLRRFCGSLVTKCLRDSVRHCLQSGGTQIRGGKWTGLAKRLYPGDQSGKILMFFGLRRWVQFSIYEHCFVKVINYKLKENMSTLLARHRQMAGVDINQNMESKVEKHRGFHVADQRLTMLRELLFVSVNAFLSYVDVGNIAIIRLRQRKATRFYKPNSRSRFKLLSLLDFSASGPTIIASTSLDIE